MGERLKLNSVSGNVVSFDTDLEKNLGSLKIGIEPVQEGSGDPSPDNVRPINGWTEAKVYRAGKNLLNTDYSAWSLRGSAYAYINNVVPKGQIARFTFTDNDTSIDISGCSIGFVYENLNNSTPASYSWIIDKGVIKRYTNTAVNGTPGLFCQNVMIYPQTEQTLQRLLARYNIMVEIGSVATEYEPYQPRTTYPITLPSAAGTVYGGTLDITTGLLTVDRKSVLARDCSFNKVTVSDIIMFYTQFDNGQRVDNPDGFCSAYKSLTSQIQFLETDKSIRFYGSESMHFSRAGIHDSRYDDYTVTEFRNAIADVQFVYPLATPQTYSLTPTEISTLLGANTLYADCGPIQEASYFSRDYVPVASDTGLITITDGVEAPIDSLKIHFEPVQEGSGDPSPENVRPISGWTGVNVIKCGKNAFDLSWMLLPTGTLENGVLTDTAANLSMAFNTTNYIPNTKYRDSIYISVTAKREGTGSANRGLIFIARYDDGTESEIIVFMNTWSDYVTQTAVTAAGKRVIGLRISYGASGNTRWYIKDVTVTIGGNIIPYEPYVGQTYPITFPSEAGTVYGGYVDVAKGELVVNRAKVDLGTRNWARINNPTGSLSNTYLFYTNPSPQAKNSFNGIISSYKWVKNYSSLNNDKTAGYIYYTNLAIRDDDYTDVNTFKTAMSGVEFVYELAEPLTYSLTHTQLSTIKGLNNIYSNANGAIEMSYYSPVKENMIATRRSVVASAPHTETASGGIASFETNMAAKLKNLTVNIEPVQDLHGQDAPYPPGGGKNKFDGEYSNSASVLKYRAIHVGDGTFTMSSNIPLTPNNNAANIFFLAGDVSTGASTTTNGVYNGQSRTVTAVDGYVTVAYRKADNTNPASYNTQIESGSTATSYAPYSNICPINGWTGANVIRCGKNLFDKNNAIVFDCYFDGNGVSYGSVKHKTIVLPCKPNVTYTVSNPSNNRRAIGYTTEFPVISQTAIYGVVTGTITTGANAAYLVIYCYNANSDTVTFDDVINSFQIELGSTSTPYELYQGNTYPITFPSEAGTVYGGTLDVTTGILTVTYGLYVFSGNEGWQVSSTPNRFYFALSSYLDAPIALQPVTTGAKQNLKSSIFGDFYYENADGVCYVYRYNPTTIRLVVNTTLASSTDEIKTLFTSSQLVYELATPQTYQLNLTEIKTLLGTNNIYADTGNTNLTYWTH